MTEEPTSEQIMAALGYIDKTIDNCQDLSPDLAWDNSEVLEMLAQVRAELVAAAGAAPQERNREEMIAAIAGGTITVPGGYGELQVDDAENIVDALLPALTAPVQVDEAKLAEVERAAAEKAWDEGKQAGYEDALGEQRGIGPVESARNPYRRNEGEK